MKRAVANEIEHYGAISEAAATRRLINVARLIEGAALRIPVWFYHTEKEERRRRRRK